MRKLFSGIAALAMVAGLFTFNTAQASHPEWDISGTNTIQFNYLGTDYPHIVTLNQEEDGDLTGSGTSGGGTYSYTLTSGEVSGNTFHYYVTYDAGNPAAGTVMHVMGTVDTTDGSVDGTWTDDFGGTRTGTFSSAAGVGTEIEDATQYTITGGGRIGNSTGKPMFTYGIEDGMLTVVNHQVRPPCVYHIDTEDMTFTENSASFQDAAGNRASCVLLDITFTNNETGDDTININGTNYSVRNGSFTIEEVDEEEDMSFSASNSTYYNCATECSDIYATGPISFTWDEAGVVTGGEWSETIGSTVYHNMITSGTVSGDNVTLHFDRTNPNVYSFNFTGTLVGGMLTGLADGYYLKATQD